MGSEVNSRAAVELVVEVTMRMVSDRGPVNHGVWGWSPTVDQPVSLGIHHEDGLRP